MKQLLVYFLFFVLVVFLVALYAMAKKLVKKMISKIEDEDLRTKVTDLCRAAEILFKHSVPNHSELKYEYVITELEKLGIENNSIVQAIIKSAIFTINLMDGTAMKDAGEDEESNGEL